jgi:hypothetical protein
VFIVIISSVILLKIWMDFKINVRDRENGLHKNISNSEIKNIPFTYNRDFNKFRNKKDKSDIIIDCEAQVIRRELDYEKK